MGNLLPFPHFTRSMQNLQIGNKRSRSDDDVRVLEGEFATYALKEGNVLSGAIFRDRPVVYVGEVRHRETSQPPQTSVTPLFALEAGSTVAIKTNHICNIALEMSVESSVREVSILRQLSEMTPRSRYFVQYVDSFRCDSHLYLVMTQAYGAPLFDALCSQKPPVRLHPDRDVIFHQLIEAVDYLHHHHIAHNDIKCENIIYDVVHKRLTLIDFGGSHVGTDLMPWHDFGTRATKAPEICTPPEPPDQQISSRALDMWAVGVIFLILHVGYGVSLVYSHRGNFAQSPLFAFSRGSQALIEEFSSGRVIRSNKKGLEYWLTMELPEATVCAHLLDVNVATRYVTSDVMQSEWWQNTSI